MIDTHEPIDLHTLVRDKIDAWHAGQAPDASRLLTEYPELRNAKSLVLDLALAEYEVRMAAGEPITKSQFCDRFPAYRQSIAKLLEVQDFLDQCPQFAVNDSTRWPAPGDEFLGFEIVEPLGRGGMARVFLARQPELGGRRVVIKVSRFASREAHTLGKLSHPSIMPVFSVKRDEVAGWTVICMPLLGAATGVDLLDEAFGKDANRDAALIRRVARETRPLERSPAAASDDLDGSLSYSQTVARIGLQLAEALAAAHAAGILHRDIKPSNVLLAWSGRPILLDFNLSSDGSAMVEGVGGTLAYMAPELIASVLTDKGQAARQFDPRYDVYSLGAVLYELLTGRLPAKPADAERLPLDAYEPWLQSKRRSPAELIAGFNGADVENELQNVITGCLSFDPADRFATADDLVAALRDCVALTSSSLPLSHSPSVAPSTVKSRRAVLAAGIGLLGAGLGFAAYYGTRRTPLELLYQQAIDEYNAGKHENAVSTFTKCLEQKPAWADALFGRAQSLRKLEKWREARVDYMALRTVEPAWSYAFAGFCGMQSADDVGADADFLAAHQLGHRDIPFLLNYARVQTRRQRNREAISTYTEALTIEPKNQVALCNRAYAGVILVRNDKKMLPSAEALADAEEYSRIASHPFEGPHCAAIVFGEAVRKDASYQEKAVTYLTQAIRQGLPLEAIQKHAIQLKPLLALVDSNVVAEGVHDSQYRVNFAPPQEFADTPSWQLFLQPQLRQKQALARHR